jgi:hypothetical protein
MDAGKYIDLAVGLAQTALGLFLAWRAFIVTLKVPPEGEHLRHKSVFVLCCIAVIVLAGTQTYRNFGLSETLARIEQGINKPAPTPIVNIPPAIIKTTPKHTHVTFGTLGTDRDMYWNIKSGEVPALDAEYTAADFQVRDPLLGAKVVVATKEHPTDLSLKQILKTLEFKRIAPLSPHKGGRFTFESASALTKDEWAAISTGDGNVCIAGAIKWADDTGKYETYLEQCGLAIKKADGSFVWQWRVGPDNNIEKKRP